MAVAQLLLLFVGVWLFASSVAIVVLAALLAAEGRERRPEAERSGADASASTA